MSNNNDYNDDDNNSAYKPTEYQYEVIQGVTDNGLTIRPAAAYSALV